MLAQRIANNLYSISLGPVNAFLVDAKDGSVLIDTGHPNSASKILYAIEELGKSASDICHIVLTHAHPDHIGSAAALKSATGAAVYAHSSDAAIVTRGSGFRRMVPSPGWVNTMLFRIFVGRVETVDPVGVGCEVEDGQVLPIAGGITAVHAPGHSAGHLALLWPENGGVLFAGDACANIFGLGWSVSYEDFVEARHTLGR